MFGKVIDPQSEILSKNELHCKYVLIGLSIC